ncbi:MAG: DUF368 domain-containing protein [Pseudomonadales bacterium]|nr:DUF368 domain-containing protein [Pseudomonadales bacterium]
MNDSGNHDGPAPGSSGAALRRSGIRAWLALALRGMAMGVAELVPGVSGGTIAFITGIYDELVRTLSRLGPGMLVTLWRRGPGAVWREHNFAFLVVLGAGMLLSVLVFAHLFRYLLDTVPPVVWAFFFGLIVASVVQIGRRRPLRLLLGPGLVGVAAGLALLLLEPVQSGTSLWVFFLGGMAAVSAWLLPAVSGSFLLLVLGLYEPVLRAVAALDLPILVAVAGGCLAGILCMARLLHWLMVHVREPVLALLTGFMAGSLVQLWPWRVDGAPVAPSGYHAATDEPALVFLSMLAAFSGMVVLWLLSRLE